ncbi:PREDICTED: chitin-binding lectin 1-like [Ficedula albicollis]|uniref:chitin-binding lectin 1-like n=1 Tax=Ficedula albicollis TaxID=59894 RepID=UPI0007AD8A98|nr:PREDICTED: chitin-binding lectin 1-like [Ficedula albicollis]
MPWDSPPKFWGTWGQTHAFALPQCPPTGSASQVGSFSAGQLPWTVGALPQKGERRRGGSCSSIPHPTQTRGRKGRCLLTPGTWPDPSPPLHGTPGRSGSQHSLRSAPTPPPRSPQPPRSCPPKWGGQSGGLNGVWGLLHACTHCPVPDVPTLSPHVTTVL